MLVIAAADWINICSVIAEVTTMIRGRINENSSKHRRSMKESEKSRVLFCFFFDKFPQYSEILLKCSFTLPTKNALH